MPISSGIVPLFAIYCCYSFDNLLPSVLFILYFWNSYWSMVTPPPRVLKFSHISSIVLQGDLLISTSSGGPSWVGNPSRSGLEKSGEASPLRRLTSPEGVWAVGVGGGIGDKSLLGSFATVVPGPCTNPPVHSPSSALSSSNPDLFHPASTAEPRDEEWRNWGHKIIFWWVPWWYSG